MNCTYCGAKIPDGDKTCPACGGAVGGEDSIPAPSPYYIETVGVDKPAPKKKKAAPAIVDVPPVPEPGTPAEVVDEPPAPATVEEQIKEAVAMPEVQSIINDRSNWAIASLVLGLLGLGSFIIPVVCSLLSSVPAIILGAMSLKSRQRKFAIAGIVLGIVEIVAGIIFAVASVAFIAWAASSGN